MKMRTLIFIALFIITIIFLSIFSMLSLIKRHTKVRDSKLLTTLKIFFGLEQEKNSITQYFTNADKILKYFLKNSTSYKYELPWYISFGAYQSGKTSFFSNVPLETPLQLSYTDTSYINHYFFNEGIVIDIKSELIFNDISNDFCWERFLNQLKKIRPMKNIDGIIYFVSLKDLLSTNPNVMLQNKKDIESLYQKLWQLQNKFEMRIPVYMVFTHLDQIKGFNDFIEIFKKYKNDMFGWSNPTALDIKFSSECLDMMKKNLDEQLKVLLSEVMVNFSAEISFNIMNFINNFQEIYPKICEYISLTFQNNKYTKGLYFRGLYFTALDSITTNYERVPYLDTESSEANISGGDQIQQSDIFFAKDLLVKKIFPEKDIGKEDVDKKKVEKETKVLKTAFGGLLSFSIVYGTIVYRNLVFFNENLFFKALKVKEVLSEYDKDSNYVQRVDFLEELKIILQYLGDLSSEKLYFYFIPSSLFSSIEKSKKNLISKATKKLVMTTLFNEIKNKFIKAANINPLAQCEKKKDPFINPLHSKEFKNLHQIVKIVKEIEYYEQKFLLLKETGSILSLQWLLERIFNIKIPDSVKNNMILSVKMDLSELDINRFYQYKKDIRKKFRLSLNNFVINCFSKDKVSEYFLELERLLFLIDSIDVGMNYDNLKNIQRYISEIVTIFNEHEFNWLKSKNFSSDELEDVLKDINSSVLLGENDTVNEVLTRTTTAFHSFKNKLSCYQLPLIGSPFYKFEDKIQLSDSILELQGSLNNVFSESFMEHAPKLDFKSLTISQAIHWDIHIIKNIVSIINDYKVFEEKYSSSLGKVDLVIKNIAKENLKNLIQYNLAKNHTVIELNTKHSNLSDFSENIKNSCNELEKILEFLMKHDPKLFKKIKNIQKQSLLNFLNYIDRAMEKEDLYDIKEDKFLLDAYNKKLFFNFNLAEYLLIQKKQLEFFANTLAEPVINFLSYINFLDNIILDDMVIKWKEIIKDLENYKTNPTSSKLFVLEELATKIQSSSLKNLFQKDLKKIEVNINKNSFLETKVFILNQRINGAVDDSISRILVEQYEESLVFYKQYSHTFPFNLNGVLIGVDGFNKMENLIKKQEDIISLIKIVKPNYDSPVFRFIENLEKLHKMVSFLMSNDKCLDLNFKQYQPIGDIYQKNLNLVVSCNAKVNGQKFLSLYKIGSIKIYDLVKFEIAIAKNCGKKIVSSPDSYCEVKNNILVFNFDKKNLMAFLMENIVEINHSSFLRFTINIEDGKGIKDTIVIMIPVDLVLDGSKYSMPDRTFIGILER